MGLCCACRLGPTQTDLAGTVRASFLESVRSGSMLRQSAEAEWTSYEDRNLDPDIGRRSRSPAGGTCVSPGHWTRKIGYRQALQRTSRGRATRRAKGTGRCTLTAVPVARTCRILRANGRCVRVSGPAVEGGSACTDAMSSSSSRTRPSRPSPPGSGLSGPALMTPAALCAGGCSQRQFLGTRAPGTGPHIKGGRERNSRS